MRTILWILAFPIRAALRVLAPRLGELEGTVHAPALEADRFLTRDGVELEFVRWNAASPRAIVVALHGMNDYSNAFSIPAPLWVRNGITTYAFDQRGFGRSKSAGLWPHTDLMRQDLVDFVDVVQSRHPGLPVVVLGESMGGAVALSAFASAHPPRAQACILVSPAIWGWSGLPFTYRVALWLAVHTLPRWRLTGDGRRINATDNNDVLSAHGRDPLYFKSTRTDAVYGLVGLMGQGAASATHLGKLPLLLLYGGNDQIIPRAVTKVFAELLGPTATVKFYPEGYHMLLRDQAAAARTADIAQWIIAQQEHPPPLDLKSAAR
jgi:alpha-beta hydrolase superfamily lysophospholipase